MQLPEAILKFNQMYKLPAPAAPTLDAVGDVRTRILNFTKTLRKEIDEGADIIDKMNQGQEPIDTLVELSDWFGDIVIYALSEAQKYGIPYEPIIGIIMKSNFSKENPDGTTTYDDAGKVMKGVNYWKPEPQIKTLLLEYTPK